MARDVLADYVVYAACALILAGAGFWFSLGLRHGSTHVPSTSVANQPATPTFKNETRTPGLATTGTAVADRAAQSDLLTALADEEAVWAERHAYEASATALQSIDSTLDWGERLQVTVIDALTRSDHGIVCLSERSPRGTTFSVAHVELGADRGTYSGPKPCPSLLTANDVATLGRSSERSQ